MSDTEQALVKAVLSALRNADLITPRRRDEHAAAEPMDEWRARAAVTALRAALPEGVVLTRDGLARVERWGYLWPEGEPTPAIDQPYWGDERDVPLYTLTPLEASDE